MADAIVVAFPQAAQIQGPERLRQAIEHLQAALVAQGRALSDWRFAMTELGVGVAGLGQSLVAYQDSLAGVEARLASLRAESADLATAANLAAPDVTAAMSRAAG